MNELVKEWVDKANADFATACRELSATEVPNHDAVCFHAQQCIEKLIKALLMHEGKIPPKSHDLVFLQSLLSAGIVVCSSQDDLRYLSRAAVEFRYPGENAQQEDALRSVEIRRHLHAHLIQRLDM